MLGSLLSLHFALATLATTTPEDSLPDNRICQHQSRCRLGNGSRSHRETFDCKSDMRAVIVRVMLAQEKSRQQRGSPQSMAGETT
jgi:hypothetical protein